MSLPPASPADETSPTSPERSAKLSPRQTEIVRAIAYGKSSKEIAVKLGVSTKTIESHRTNLFRKCKFRSLADVVRYAIRQGLIEP